MVSRFVPLQGLSKCVLACRAPRTCSKTAASICGVGLDLEQEKAQKEYADLVEEHKGLVRFKSNATKVGLAILTSAGAVIAFFLNKWLGL